MENDLSILREQIDSVDKRIIECMKERMEIVRQIGEYKKERNMAVLDRSREDAKLMKLAQEADEVLSEEEIVELFEKIMEISRNRQTKNM